MTTKNIEQIVSDWENTKMTKKEIVRHFAEILKMDEKLMKDRDQEILDLRHEKNEKIARIKSDAEHFLSEIHRNYEFLKNLEKKMESNLNDNLFIQEFTAVSILLQEKVTRQLNSFYK
tara:strand:- start:578 stop:931 length:354 start_codon:yes stop_codon:yes gene_type:complete